MRTPLWDLRPSDRRVLEDVILAHHAAQPAPRSLLFIGVARGQRRYEALLRGHRYITADIDRARARHGSSQGHVVACASELDRHLDAASFDLAVMNGVIGWGLDDAATADRAIAVLHRLLRPGGELLLGWNERPGRRPFDPLALPALRRFEACVFAPLGRHIVDVPGWRRHRYAFFRQPFIRPQAGDPPMKTADTLAAPLEDTSRARAAHETAERQHAFQSRQAERDRQSDLRERGVPSGQR